jgi:hypothetical protein
VTWNDTSLYVDIISCVLKLAALPTQCNNITLPSWNIARLWYCAYPSIWECALPRNLPINEVQVEEDDLLGLGLGRPIYIKAQVEEFLKFRTPRDQTDLSAGDSRACL